MTAGAAGRPSSSRFLRLSLRSAVYSINAREPADLSYSTSLAAWWYGSPPLPGAGAVRSANELADRISEFDQPPRVSSDTRVMRTLLRGTFNDVFQVRRPFQGRDIHLKAAMAWLCRAQDAAGNDGVARSYALRFMVS